MPEAPRSRRRSSVRWSLLVAALLLCATRAHADAGDLQLEVSAGYRSREAADVLVGGTLGLGDFTAARARAGVRVGDLPTAGRLELTAAYVFDVLAWVPEVSAGVALDVDEVDAVLTGLAFVGVRRYVSRESFVALELGGELGPEETGWLLRVSFGF